MFYGRVSRFALIALSLAGQPLASSQVITVRLLNARTGNPVKLQNVSFDWDRDMLSTELFIDQSGSGSLVLPLKVTSFRMRPGPKRGTEPYRTAYLDCSGNVQISVEEVLKQGFVPPNNCSKTKTEKRPGELVFWGLPIPWWHIDFQ